MHLPAPEQLPEMDVYIEAVTEQNRWISPRDRGSVLGSGEPGLLQRGPLRNLPHPRRTALRCGAGRDDRTTRSTCQDLPKAVMATAGAAAEENRPTMRTTVLLTIAGGLALAAIGLRTAADDRPDAGRRDRRSRPASARRSGPFLETYCLGCHGKEKPKGDLDLSAFTTAEAVAKDLPRWELVLEQLEAGSMPPAKAKRQPDGRGPRRASSTGSGRSASTRRSGTPAIPARSWRGG